MRILFAHNDYGRPSGEEHAIDSTARLLAEHGHEIVWLRKSSAPIMKSLRGQAHAFFAGIHSPRSRSELASLLDRQQFDLLHVQNLYPLLSPSILGAARRRGVPVVMRCPNYRLLCPNGLHLCHGQICERCLGGKEWWAVVKNCERNYFKSLGYALRNATARISGSIRDNVTTFIVLSEFQKQRFCNAGNPARQLSVLHNFVDLPAESDVPELGDTVAFLGRPAKEKEVGLFLEAARALPEYPFAVAGDLASYPGIERAAPPNVRFHGFLNGKELDDFCRRMRMLVAPSNWYEGFPNSIARAMAFGKPVVCSRIGALPEIVIDEQTGLLHDPNSADEVVSHIRRLFSDPEMCRRMGGRGRRRAGEEYGRERFYERLLAIYEAAMAEVEGEISNDK